MSGTLHSPRVSPGFGVPGSLTVRLRPHLRGGRIVEWELGDPAGVARAAHRWGDGVSFLQSDHLATMADKRSDGRPHHGFLLAAARFDGPLDEKAMSGALTAFVRRHEEQRAHYRSGDSGPERWVAPPEAFEFRVARRAGEALVVEDDDLGLWVGRRASETARAELIPGTWCAAAVDDDAFTFFFATDHAHGDGYSSALALSEIVALYRERSSGVPAELGPAGAFGDSITAERAAAAALTSADERVALWRDALSANDGRPPRCPLELGLTDGTPQPAVAVEHWLLTPEQLARCDTRLAATGGGFAGLLYAALARHHRESTGEARFFVSTVLARRDAGHERTQGWLCNFAPVIVDSPQGPDTSFDGLVRIATESVRAARRAASVPAHGVLGLLAGEGVFKGLDGSPYMVSYTDVRRLGLGADPVLSTMQTSSGVGPTRNANLWFTRTDAGLVMRSHVPDNEVARSSVLGLFERVESIVADYAAGAPESTSADPRQPTDPRRSSRSVR
ncbi:condensation domain-containing protein [Gordonia alkanivorans]|uniref:condensation domain-containing protein n=1 Tax=Gordonia alkanivorans TaxID=84096 RepID=UPI00244AFF01|nr:condensation domain-containing protein [Gordonia alkanivorans]MDH3040878.1 condensation domain-containing protein [Gordonia alkanivorans]